VDRFAGELNGKAEEAAELRISPHPDNSAGRIVWGACAFIAVEIFLPDLLELCERQIGKFPGWQIHMGATCIEVTTFFVFLFFLELFETRSRLTAWRASAPWLPLVGLTLLATIIHIPTSL
jgi:hypothetical protein